MISEKYLWKKNISQKLTIITITSDQLVDGLLSTYMFMKEGYILLISNLSTLSTITFELKSICTCVCSNGKVLSK